MTNSKDLYLRLLRYVKHYKLKFSYGVIGMVVFAATEPAIPALLKPMLDGSFIEKDKETIIFVPIILIIIYVIRGGASFTTAVALNWVSYKVITDLRNEMFQKVIALPNKYYDNHTTGSIISKLTYDVNQIGQSATEVLIILIRDSLAIIGLIGWMFYLNWRLSLFIFITAPIVILIVRSVSIRLRHINRSLQDQMGSFTHLLEESISGQQVIKMFNGSQYEIDRFKKMTKQIRLFNMKNIVASNIITPIIQIVSVSALSAIIYIASIQSLSDKITVGEFISFIGAMAMLITPVKRITGVNAILQRGLAASESVFNLIDQKQEKTPDHPIKLGEIRLIEFKNISTSYPGSKKEVLKDIQLTINHGETVALVGLSGSGKTTLTNLLPLFYSPTEGQILINNIDIQRISIEELRNNISLVSQDIVLFNDTIASNISYGSMNNSSIKQIHEVAKRAHAIDFIEELPNGFNSTIGENGSQLSGGQRQRIAIARAILKNAPILILDEATSALDSHSEKQVQLALDELVKDRTTLMIAHRLSTIKKADRIIVMDKGKIVEEGTHDSLYKLGGIYTHLYDLQFQESTS